jgi:protein-S-isoprenylcysteine O-methyltransferase Ste14
MPSITLSHLKALSLSLFMLLSTYTTWLCSQPPNPTPYDSSQPDSLRLFVSPFVLFIPTFINLSLGLYHVFLTLTYPSVPTITCPHSSNLVPSLFTWTPRSVSCIAAIFLGSYIRLSAFSALGSNFTFRLKEPKGLITTGLYSYVQHPSYIGMYLIGLGNWGLFFSLQGSAGCWVPEEWMAAARLGLGVLGSAIVVMGNIMMWKRVKEEEMMLKSVFGKGWEDWHKRTSRFIPGLF